LPSQQQLRWSQLKVGITVIAATLTLAVLIFLMRGTSGVFTERIALTTYFDNAEGLRQGQPVDLQGVPVGNVESVRVVAGRKDKPVEVVMRVNRRFQPFIREDAQATVTTAGVLGESFVDIESRFATGAPVKDGAELPSANAPGVQDVIRSSQGSLQNLDILVKRLDRIVAEVESGRGSLGKILNDPTLVNKATAILNQVQGLLNDVSAGKGTVGRLLADETLANKLVDSVDKLDRIVDDISNGKGNLGLLVKDDTFMKNANQTIVKANKLMDDVNSGRGTLGRLTRDEDLANKLQNTINKLSAITDRLEKGEGSAGKFLRDPSFYDNTDKLLVESRNLVKAIRENPKKYLTIQLKIF
jgi:phospholipid/cholesterol/gamma-HCH transport system substrate-binding protein